jgi:hypothetical protein
MTAMVQEFDGVRELSMEEVDAVAGGPIWKVLIGGAIVLSLATRGCEVKCSQTETEGADGSTSTTTECSMSRN